MLTVSLVASAGQAQSPPPGAPPQGPPVFTPEQLEQLLAPIALHPDPLVGQILMAATYPLEVVQATRWLQDPNHAALTGPALAAALDLRPWDPSVKALVPFPEILRMMDGSLSGRKQSATHSCPIRRPSWTRSSGCASGRSRPGPWSPPRSRWW